MSNEHQFCVIAQRVRTLVILELIAVDAEAKDFVQDAPVLLVVQ